MTGNIGSVPDSPFARALRQIHGSLLRVIPGPTDSNSQLTSWHRWNAFLSGSVDSTKESHLSLAVFPAKSQRSLLNWRTENCIPGDRWAVPDSPKLTIALSVHSSAAKPQTSEGYV